MPLRKYRSVRSTTAARARSKPRKYPPFSPTQRDRARPAAPGWPMKLSRRCSCLPLARAVDERRRTEAGQDLDQQYFATVGLDDLVANDLGTAIVRALYQCARLDLRDQLDRRVFLEDHDEIDRFQRRQYFGAGTLVLNRTPVALQPLHRSIAVQADDQPVAGATRRGQYLDVTGMQNIETPVGEANPQTLLPPIRKTRLKVAAGRDNLFLSRKKRMRQDFSSQF